MQDVLTLILGGGRGARLYPLTKRRSEPAVPIAGKYRLIDIPISNCLNSGLKRIYVLTQFLSVSLHRHISNAYKLDPFSRGFIEVLAAQQTNESADWYQGTADALRQNLPYLQEDRAKEFLILSGDQLYHLDFRELIRAHRESRAAITLAVVPVARRQAGDYGIIQVDNRGRVTDLVEKPGIEQPLDGFTVKGPWREALGPIDPEKQFLANMGIYVFKRSTLLEVLTSESRTTDLVHDVFYPRIQSHSIQGYLFGGYWEDVGSIRAYHEANLALAGENPPFDFHSPEGVIYTRMRHLRASQVRNARVDHCLISDGCIIQSGTSLERCVIGVRSRIGRNTRLRETIVIGADRYETDRDRAENQHKGIPDLGVGENSVIERAILDKDCRIGRGVQITNRANVQETDAGHYVIRDGIVVIPNGAIVPDGMVI